MVDDVFDEARAERARAHVKHGVTSMESTPAHDPTGRRFRILTEEVGEVAEEFNDAEHEGRPVDLAQLRTELIQVAAMAGAWADACSDACSPLEVLAGRDVDGVLREFGVCDGLINTDEDDVVRMAAEVVALREVLVFADGACVMGTGRPLADLYNETTPVQQVLARAGCHPRGGER